MAPASSKGRDFAAWLGLIPKQESTGDRTILGRMSKRGNKYVRTLFVQAARVVLERRPRTAKQGPWPWIEPASQRLHRNMLAIALANSPSIHGPTRSLAESGFQVIICPEWSTAVTAVRLGKRQFRYDRSRTCGNWRSLQKHRLDLREDLGCLVLGYFIR